MIRPSSMSFSSFRYPVDGQEVEVAPAIGREGRLTAESPGHYPQITQPVIPAGAGGRGNAVLPGESGAMSFMGFPLCLSCQAAQSHILCHVPTNLSVLPSPHLPSCTMLIFSCFPLIGASRTYSKRHHSSVFSSMNFHKDACGQAPCSPLRTLPGAQLAYRHRPAVPRCPSTGGVSASIAQHYV